MPCTTPRHILTIITHGGLHGVGDGVCAPTFPVERKTAGIDTVRQMANQF